MINSETSISSSHSPRQGPEEIYLPTDRELLLERMGAFFDWTWCRHLEQYLWTLLYWPSSPEQRKSQVVENRPDDFWSGYMSRERGCHWNRYSLLRRK